MEFGQVATPLVLESLFYIFVQYLLIKLTIFNIEKGNKFSSVLSTRLLMLSGLSTTLVVIFVKSSLALSLGLVGALSIVRFRTPIKNPSDLGFIFLVIASGVGIGSGNLLPTSMGVILINTLLFLEENRSKNETSYFIEISGNQVKDLYTVLNNQEFTVKIEIIRYEFNSEDSGELVFNCKNESLAKVQELINGYSSLNYSVSALEL
tara:strand:+ start:155 stop:775 length:621 start_codon:yes stop_codon:yes gene_type:complete